jgi:hypothetical protein
MPTYFRFRSPSVLALLMLAAALIQTGSAFSAEKQDPERIQGYATDISQGIIQGIAEGDFDKYATDFSEAMRKAVNRETFLLLQKNLQKKVGKFQSMEYLGSYVQEGDIITLFKARFSKTKDDVLVKLVLDHHKPAPRVTGLWFDAPSLRNGE